MKAQIKLTKKTEKCVYSWEAAINGSQLVVREGRNAKFKVHFIDIKPKAGRNFQQEAIKEMYKRIEKKLKNGYVLFKDSPYNRVKTAYDMVEATAKKRVACNRKKDIVMGIASEKFLNLIRNAE